MTPAADLDVLSLRDVEQFLCAPYGIEFQQLAGFPPATTTTKKAGARWAAWDVAPWLTGFFRGLAHTRDEFHAMVRVEATLRPYASSQEHRERALDRFTQVAVARVLMRKAPV